MNRELITKKIRLDNDTLLAIMADIASEPALHGRSPEDLQTLLFEILGVLTGDSPRDEFPRTEIDRVVFGIARPHLEQQGVDGLSRRLAWQSLWFGVRPLTASV